MNPLHYYGWTISNTGVVRALTRPAVRGRPHIPSAIAVGTVERRSLPHVCWRALDNSGTSHGDFVRRGEAAQALYKRLHQ